MEERYQVIHSDCLSWLKTLPDNSVESCVTDPPYELSDGGRGGFMGKTWDASGIAFSPELWSQVYRVLKPGAFAVIFGAERKIHRVTCAVEDVGFEIRHLGVYASATSFPKSMSASKAIDAKLGKLDEREVVGVAADFSPDGFDRKTNGSHAVPHEHQGSHGFGDRWSAPVTRSASEEAALWEGWGTALKTIEPHIIVRKPLDGTVAENLIKWGVGAINIDRCRLPWAYAGEAKDVDQTARPNTRNDPAHYADDAHVYGKFAGHPVNVSDLGRWPSTLVCSDLDMEGPVPGVVALAEEADDAHGVFGAYTKYFRIPGLAGWKDPTFTVIPQELLDAIVPTVIICPKAGAGEREMGCGKIPAKWVDPNREEDGAGRNNPRAGAGRKVKRHNTHPTVKAVSLMRHLVRLVTPPNGLVIDPFTGSGSTGVACVWEGMRFAGSEMNDTDEEPFVRIAQARIRYATTRPAPALEVRISQPKKASKGQLGLDV